MAADAPMHPYYPLSASIPAYVANESSVLRLVTTFVVLVGLVAGLAYWSAIRTPSSLRPIDKFAVVWFAVCYFLYHRSEIPRLQTVFAQLWKEYALSDSRYLTLDVFTVCVEGITVFAWGPLSWLTYFGIVNNSPSRHITQAIVCTAHLYGVALYYATNWAERQISGTLYSRPEFLYYWVYYIGLNAPWAVVPFGMPFTLLFPSFLAPPSPFTLHEVAHRFFVGVVGTAVLLFDSYRQTAKAFRALHEQQSTRPKLQ
ncbi:emopamil binding protein [Moelleriella libera RCEF 2490]|uniref:Emopamil binding protein n=1 Tax=Moelleriella libera RCEF 2490 TaxID=1081109 RepID=A0A167X7C0_9HYPO|nr:emopamil binding protein [Moelleriella libera RCEF 2490]